MPVPHLTAAHATKTGHGEHLDIAALDHHIQQGKQTKTSKTSQKLCEIAHQISRQIKSTSVATQSIS